MRQKGENRDMKLSHNKQKRRKERHTRNTRALGGSTPPVQQRVNTTGSTAQKLKKTQTNLGRKMCTLEPRVSVYGTAHK